jgi:hypothetical protein
MTKKIIVFIGSSKDNVKIQKKIVEELALNYKVFLLWTADSNCNPHCHPSGSQNVKKYDKIIDLGHIDLKMFKDLPNIIQIQWFEVIIISINQVIPEFATIPYIMVYMPTLRTEANNLILEMENHFRKSESNVKRALVLTNVDDAKLSMQFFQDKFSYYEILSLYYDQINSRFRIPKSDIGKIYSLIENLS